MQKGTVNLPLESSIAVLLTGHDLPLLGCQWLALDVKVKFSRALQAQEDIYILSIQLSF